MGDCDIRGVGIVSTIEGVAADGGFSVLGCSCMLKSVVGPSGAGHKVAEISPTAASSSEP